MQVVADRVAGAAHMAQQVAGFDDLPRLHGQVVHVAVQRRPAVAAGVLAVVQLHKIAVRVVESRLGHDAVLRGVHRRALGGGEVVAAVAAVHRIAADVGVVDRAGKARAGRRVVQVGQAGGVGRKGDGGGLGRGGALGRQLGQGGGGLGRFRRGFGHGGLHHAGRDADADAQRAQRQRQPAQAAVAQQVHDARFGAALPKGQAAGGQAALQGVAQNRLAVGVAGGRVAAAHGGFVAGGFHLALQLAESQPRQRVEPVQAGHGVKQRFYKGVAAAQVGALMQQHGGAHGAGQPRGQVDARAHDAQRERRGHARPAVAAVGRFAGQRHLAAQPPVGPHGAHGQHQHARRPHGGQQMPYRKARIPRRGGRHRGRGGGGQRGRGGRGAGQNAHGIGGLGQRLILGARQCQRDAPRQRKPQPHGQPQPAQPAAGRVQAAQQRADGQRPQRGGAAP